MPRRKISLSRTAALTCLGAVVGIAASAASPSLANQAGARQKLNAYISCTNRLSERSYQSRDRYFSWAAKSGPTGRERIIYGTYTIYDTAPCTKAVERANALEPRDAELEAAASAYVAAVTALAPLLKEADDYYTAQNYKDDKMAKGRALHPRLVAAWTAFETADRTLRSGVETWTDRATIEELKALEASEGRKARWHVQTLMLHAKALLRTQNTPKPDLAKITRALDVYEKIVQDTDAFAATPDGKAIATGLIGAAKTFLTTSKQLMRRLRDKVPYSQGEKMMLSTGQGAWMVEGSPARLTRDYNQLVDAFNRANRF